MDFTNVITRQLIHHLLNCLLIVFLVYDVRITGSQFLKRPVASQFLASGNTPRAKRMRSSHIAGSSSSLVELEGWQELIRGKRVPSGGGLKQEDGRLSRLLVALDRLEADAEQLRHYLPSDLTPPRPGAERGQHRVAFDQSPPQMSFTASKKATDIGDFLERDVPQSLHPDKASIADTNEKLSALEMVEKLTETLEMLNDRVDDNDKVEEFGKDEDAKKAFLPEYTQPELHPEEDKGFW